ncbi:hypothetical protein ACFO3D_12460 [Virgibacillus kekensis]|uniref:Uncharacterized protein n=1 Tax=Virgibacillus kekensis TaxID=202261 RepID=A0ABV9DJI5_9BACI
MYWITALATYLFSFLAGFGIGQITVGFTFVFIILAIAHSFNWIKNGMHYMAFLVSGLVIGGLAITYVDDALLFFPFVLLG